MNRLRICERGATAVEYALISGIIALGIIIGLKGIRSSINIDYNNIAYGLSKAAIGPTAQKTIISSSPGQSYTSNGYYVDVTRIVYSDGSSDTLRKTDSKDSWFKTQVDHIDANGFVTDTAWIDQSGGQNYSQNTKIDSSNIYVSQQGNGSCNCTYRSNTTYDPQPDGSTNVIYHNDLVEGSHAASWMYASIVSVYNATKDSYNFVGDITTSTSGVKSTNGQNVSRYQ